jgi:cystathionine beta-lyase/cystathionine gamma-synthase
MAAVTTVKGDSLAARPGVGASDWVDGLARARRPGPFQRTTRTSHAESWLPATLAVHAGTHDDPATGAVGTPIYQTSTFLLDGDQYDAVADGYARDRFVYSRYGNPSQWAVQEKLAALEGAESAIVFSSGMAAITAAVLSMVDRGAHVVASDELYGGTYNLFHHELPSLGISVTFVDPRDHDRIQESIRPETMLLYVETMTNPLLKVVDIPAIGEIAARHRLRLVVDATFTTPMAMHVLEHGAHVVVHSCTKYLNGHSDVVAGVAMGARKHIDQIWPRLLAFGGCLDPHACFLLERSLKTLPLRMRAHAQGAQAVAEYLEAHPKVQLVRYPGLASHPDHALASSLLATAGGMVTFAVESDAAAQLLLDRMTLMRQATSLGGVETLVSLPFNTSHATYTADQRARLGIPRGCVRLSVGIEDPLDLIADLDQALTSL